MQRNQKILLDTNFLMLPAQHKLDIYMELKSHSLLTLKQCITELERLAKGKSKRAVYARIALQLARKNAEIVNAKGSTDSAVIGYALQNACAVATNDRNLIKSLKRHNIKIIRLRQEKYLVEE